MLRLQYIGLLNTDRHSQRPVQMFLQGQSSHERYVLDRLPPWIELLVRQAKETATDMRYIPSTNLDLLNGEARAAVYQQLIEGGYKVRRLGGSTETLLVNMIFCP